MNLASQIGSMCVYNVKPILAGVPRFLSEFNT